MKGSDLLNWTADKNGLADAQALAAELCFFDWIPSLRQMLDACPELASAYARLSKLDSNGALCAHTDLRDAWSNKDSLESFLYQCARIASEIDAACDAMLQRDRWDRWEVSNG
jgi:hypothetical protein